MNKHTKTVVTVLFAVLVSACATGNGGGDDSAVISGKEIVPGLTVPVSTLSVDAQQFLSPREICDVLTPEDVAPLTNGKVTDKPTETTDLGLPGCQWPVQDGWGWFELSVFEPVSIDALISVSEEIYPIGDRTVYQTYPDGGSCHAIVVSPKAPEGYVLGLDLQGIPRKTAGNPDLCELSIPQTTKVLERLGW